ncbi:MAG: serine/threonine-protein kinase HipA [Kiritimatiellia bacterium]|jgi:serine/threonine-protein kinase HipA
MPRCCSTLNPINEEGFSPAAAKKLFDNRKPPACRLEFTRKDVITYRHQQAERFSISGIQDKISLRLHRGTLAPVTENGEYILKPIPSGDHIHFNASVPANEHLCMLLAGQLFNISVPPCALVEMSDGEPAYLVRRFDRRKDGNKTPQEDFCQLSNRSEENADRNYKYDSTQEETGRIVKQFCAAHRIELEKLFLRHVFNYVFSNGDAHLKNFSLHQTAHGDHVLTPAYDLLCTSMHIPSEARCALDMFEHDETRFFRDNSYYGLEDFSLLADKFGIEQDYALFEVNRFEAKLQQVEDLTGQSYLDSGRRNDFLSRVHDRLKALRADA